MKDAIIDIQNAIDNLTADNVALNDGVIEGVISDLKRQLELVQQIDDEQTTIE